MSSCEKCWSDAYRQSCGLGESQPAAYARLMEERKEKPCTPEQQAGKDAGTCPICLRKTLHQHTQEPMCGCEVPK